MLKDLNSDQLLLAELMSSISEDGFSASWMEGLEYELWEILNGGDCIKWTLSVGQDKWLF
jgi:hypothetical protein